MSNQVFIAIDFGPDFPAAVLAFYTRGNSPRPPFGAISLMHSPDNWIRNATPETIEWEIAKAFPGKAVVSWQIVQQADIPTDRTYRNAWKKDGPRIVHDMSKARELHVARIRRFRQLALEKSDASVNSALDKGDNQAERDARKERQRLRDLPATLGPAIEAAADIEALKLVWDPALDGG